MADDFCMKTERAAGFEVSGCGCGWPREACALERDACGSVSIGGVDCSLPKGHQGSHYAQGMEWSVGK